MRSEYMATITINAAKSPQFQNFLHEIELTENNSNRRFLTGTESTAIAAHAR